VLAGTARRGPASGGSGLKPEGDIKRWSDSWRSAPRWRSPAAARTSPPDTYAEKAVQQANKVDQGVVIGVRQVDISAATTLGTATGAAAGGLVGSQLGDGVSNAFSTLGGVLVGGLGGTAAEHALKDTTGYEYIVRKANGDLLSVTQKDETPLAVGQHVLVIAGPQARVVADYTVPVEGPPQPSGNAPAVATAPPTPLIPQ
jgi:outer membrane lipoprotein SlyB